MKGFAKSLVLTLALVFTVGAFAAEKNVTLNSPINLNGQKIAAGEYQVKYQVSGSTAEVKFFKNNKEVASSSAQVVEQSEPFRTDGVITKSDAGTKTLVELQFAGQKSAIRFGAEGPAGK